ncbi:MAG: FAD binding domain-containing protein, partial [Gemmatimonadota bacterium]|nr:FAD binding domain-containing protein [Gemmatimonadota bacterium]
MNVLRPGSVREALGMLADEPTAIPLAGGTDLLVHWPANHAGRDATYLDLGRPGELRAHHWTDKALVLGGTTTYWDVIRDPRSARDLPLL